MCKCEGMMEDFVKSIVGVFLWMIIIALAIGGYFAPTIIATLRKHHYKWVIFAITLIFGLSGMGYLVALIWAVWPRETTVVDTVAKDVTTNATIAESSETDT